MQFKHRRGHLRAGVEMRWAKGEVRRGGEGAMDAAVQAPPRTPEDFRGGRAGGGGGQPITAAIPFSGPGDPIPAGLPTYSCPAIPAGPHPAHL
jgi:hypothetical protein